MNRANLVLLKKLGLWTSAFLFALVSFAAQATQTEQSYTTAKRYNSVGQLTGIIYPRPAVGRPFPVIRYTYNAQGLVETTEEGILNSWQDDTVAPQSWPLTTSTISKTTIQKYDNSGRKISQLVSVADDVDMVVEYAYDDYGRLKCQANRLSGIITGNACTLSSDIGFGQDRISTYEYNSADQLTFERKAVGTSLEQIYLENRYNTKGQLTDQIDANRNLSHLEYYTDTGRVHELYFPESITKGSEHYSTSDKEVYTYDSNGNRKSLTKRDGKVISYNYDALNREIRKYIPVPSDHSFDVISDYDLLSLKISSKFANGKGLSNVFDGFGELVQESTNVNGTTYTVKSNYDKHGNRVKQVYPGNKTFVYSYNGLDAAADIREDSSIGVQLIENRYDDFARPQYQTTLGDAEVSLDYDSANRVAQIGLSVAGNVYDFTAALHYNPVGQIISYDLSNDLYQYKEKGSRTGTYTANGLNQYQSVAGKTYGYDKNGNLTSDGYTTYGYDVENRLISATGAKNANLSYDPSGRLYQIQSGSKITYFLYSGDSMVAEYKNGVLSRRHVYGAGVDKPLVSYVLDQSLLDTRQFLHSNHQGSVIAATNSSGQILYVNTYDAYGVPSLVNQGRFAYTGQSYLPELGMYYYKARIYYPQIGRFLQTDPIGYKDDYNLYAYVGNDPVNRSDPTGQVGEFITLRLVLAGAALDAATPDPSDAAAPAKVVVYGGAIAGTAIGGALVWGYNKITDLLKESETNESGESDSGKSRNKPPAELAEAEGRPHSIIEKPGKEGQYTTHNGDGTKKQYRGAGKDHGPVPRPNVKEFGKNTTPNGQTFPDKGRVRPPRPEEVPH